jgi:hypothetical protein
MRSEGSQSEVVDHVTRFSQRSRNRYGGGLDEHYDLVIVGCDLSGLAAAHLFRERAGVDKKILILISK